MYGMSDADARTRLIDSTRELLWERGYAAMSPRAIMQRAEVGQGSMYHHFTGKADLAATAFADNAERTLAAARRSLAGAGSARERLIGYLNRRREVLRGCPVGRMAQDAEALDTPELAAVLRTTFAELRGLAAAAAAEGVASGELPEHVDPDELAETVLAVVQGGYVLARAEGSPAPFDRAIAGAVALIKAASS